MTPKVVVSEMIDAMLVGSSAEMRRLRELIERVGPASIPVLIEGPTGAGKDVVARALHLASGRAGAFVPFNVCAIAEGLFEDALFGHAQGAFTGAVSQYEGYLAQAENGTVFFDEIGDLSLAAQAKLLRVIETREFRPVGAKHDRRSDFRVVAATNAPLDERRAQGRFRDDLLYRIGKLVLRVPPLADRPEDIPLLAEHCLAGCKRDGATVSLTGRAMRLLQDQPWCGNVRELESVLQTAVLMCTGRVIDTGDLAPLLTGRDTRLQVRAKPELRRTVDAVRDLGGDATAAAQLLGIDKTTVYRRLKRASVDLGVIRERGDLGE